MVTKIPLCLPDISREEIEVVAEVLRKGELSHGSHVSQFEANFAALVGVKHAIAMNSWTSAAFLVFSYLKEKFGSGEVILPSMSFVASANVVLNAGLTPVFADVDPRSGNIRVDDIKPLMNKRTVAIMPVHIAGLPSPMEDIATLARDFGVLIVEDSAECLGASINGRLAGSFGIGIFSFYATKNMTTAEGGMVTTDFDELSSWLRMKLGHGIVKNSYTDAEGNTFSWNRNAVVPGHNFRLSNLQAALGVVQLKRVLEMNKRRQIVASEYAGYLSDIDEISLPPILDSNRHSYQMFIIRVPRLIRNRLVLYLNENGIGASVHFDPPIHKQSAYETLKLSLPNTEEFSQRCVSLPISSVQTSSETEFVARRVKRFFQELNLE